MPNRQIPRVQHPPSKELLRGLCVLVVPLSADVTNKHNLANFLGVALDIDHGPVGHVRLDNARRQTRQEAVALSCHLLVLLMQWEGIPRWHVVALGDGAVCLSQAIHMHRVQVQVGHLFEEMSRGRAGGHCNLHGLSKLLSFVGIAQQCVHGRRSVEMRDVLLFQELPDHRVVDLPQAVVGSTNRCHSPGECPTYIMSVSPIE